MLSCFSCHASKWCLPNTTKSFNLVFTFMKHCTIWTPSSRRFSFSHYFGIHWTVISFHLQCRLFQWMHLLITEGKKERKYFLIAVRDTISISSFHSKVFHGGWIFFKLGTNFYAILEFLPLQKCLSGYCTHKTLEAILKFSIYATLNEHKNMHVQYSHSCQGI